MVNNIELNILELLASRTDVNWSWYNLDRAMTKRKMEGVGNVARLVRNLCEAGFVDILPGSPAGMDHYQVSGQGIRLLEELHHKDSQSDLS
ncbi:hypothetical protein [Franconibacter daqui]|uniref:hypothetical protein n=1 Tax=Franconibacter daqui TaxID=2047724 RepID=UPI0030D1727D